MDAIRTVAIFGASGNFGQPITRALLAAGFDVTAITRPDSATAHPPGLRVVRAEYSVPALTTCLRGHDAAISCVGPAGLHLQSTMLDAAALAGVRRFIVNDFGWGPYARVLPEMEAVHGQRGRHWEHARAAADADPAFSWTGLSTGTPIDWALPRFGLMGFDVEGRTATIYDAGVEWFTGTTLEGIGRAVVGVLRHPEETRNRFVRVRSVMTCQNELLAEFENVSGRKWSVVRSTANELLVQGRDRYRSGKGGWILYLVVYQMYDPGQARHVIAATREESDADLLGVKEESARDIVKKVLCGRGGQCG